MRLLLMLLAATIVWIRATDANASVDQLLKKMLVYAKGGVDKHGHSVVINKFDVMLDSRMVLLGALACGARLAAVLVRYKDFHADGIGWVFSIETTAAGLSILHWLAHAVDHAVIRLNVWDERKQHTRNHAESIGHRLVTQYACNMWRGDGLATLGGSAAMVDVSCATIIAFTDTPLRSGSHNFDAVARLLTAVLIALTGICRCLFSIALTGVLAQHDHSTPARVTILAAITFWLTQLVAVSSCICSLFVVPLSVHITRRVEGHPTQVALGILAFMITLAGPRITANISGISKLN